MWTFLQRWILDYFLVVLVIGIIISFFFWMYWAIAEVRLDIMFLRERLYLLENKGSSLLDSLFMNAVPFPVPPPRTPPPEEEEDTTTVEVNLNQADVSKADAVRD